MSGISKSFSLILIVLLAVSSLIIAKPANAQSSQTGQTPNTSNWSDYIPTPEIPQFTVNFVYSTYNKTMTDPKTGVVTTQQVNNSTIDIIIKNQPFAPYNYSYVSYLSSPIATVNTSTLLRYDVQVRGHYPPDWGYSEDWKDVYVPPREYAPWLLPEQSTSDYTLLTLPQNQSYQAGMQFDFRVSAIIGSWFPPPPNSTLQFFFGAYYSKNSSWSEIQTITIPTNSNVPSPTPTVPEFSTWIILPLFATMIALSTMFVRKRILKKNITFLV